MSTLRHLAIMISALISISAAAQEKTGIAAHRGFWNCEEAGYAKDSIAELRCAQEAGNLGINPLTTDYPLKAREIMKEMKVEEISGYAH